MSFSKIQLADNAYILHTRKYQNTSLLVDVFTKQHGRFTALAKGARNPKSKFFTQLQPFIKLDIVWYPKEGLSLLVDVESDSTSVISASNSAIGFYVNELMVNLLHEHDESADLFELYDLFLVNVKSSSERDVSLRYFELGLLENIGYAQNLVFDVADESLVVAEGLYQYYIERGPKAISADDRCADSRDGGQLTVHGETLLSLEQRELSSQRSRVEAKSLMRSIINYYLNGKEIKSRELFVHK